MTIEQSSRIFLTALLVATVLGLDEAQASQYSVEIDTSEVAGLSGMLVFDLTSTDSTFNQAAIFNFTHDGQTGLPETEGGLIEGDIILLLNPAPYTSIGDGFFFNELRIPFTAFGSSITFTVQVTNDTPSTNDVPLDELSLYMLRPDGRRRLFATADPLGSEALFALCVNGTSTGLLSVFAPAQLTSPSTIEITVPDILVFTDGFELGNTSKWTVSVH